MYRTLRDAARYRKKGKQGKSGDSGGEQVEEEDTAHWDLKDYCSFLLTATATRNPRK